MKKEKNPVLENKSNLRIQSIVRPEEGPRFSIRRPIFFIGFMGAGKTTISRALSKQTGLPVVDLDAYLEEQEQRTTAQIFAADGEDGFRDIETGALSTFAHGEPMIVSCGGGIIKRNRNREILRESGFVIYLQVSADEAKARIGDTSSRPMFQNIKVARRTNEERTPLYLSCADIWIMTNGKSIQYVVDEVQETLVKAGVLCPLPESQ